MSDSTTIGCEEALRLLALYLDGELQGSDREGVAGHLKTCRSCYSRAEFEGRLKAELGRLAHDEVRPAFNDRIRQLLTQFTSSPTDEPVE